MNQAELIGPEQLPTGTGTPVGRLISLFARPLGQANSFVKMLSSILLVEERFGFQKADSFRLDDVDWKQTS
jgi:hypothetical protein